MVQSILDKSITYTDTDKIDPSDLDFDANLYETEVYKKNVI